MTRSPKWKKAEARAAVEAIATAVADAFGVAAPKVFLPEHREPRDWEWRFETVAVWTKAGPAEMNVDIDAEFAHMYFRFDDPARAANIAHGFGRLNRHSGKWNSLVCPPVELASWIEELKRDFARVAERNPDPAEVAAHEARVAAENARWEQLRQDWAADRAAKEATS